MSKIKILFTKENEDYFNIFNFLSDDKIVLDDIRKALNTNGDVWNKEEYPSVFKSYIKKYSIFSEYKHFIFRTMNDVDVLNSEVSIQECESLIKYIETKDESHIINIFPHTCKYYNMFVELVKTNFFDNHELEFDVQEGVRLPVPKEKK